MWKRRGNMGHPVFLRLSISQSPTPHWTSKGGHKGPCHYTWGCAHLHGTGMSQKAPQIFHVYSQSCCWGLSASWGRNPGFGGPPDAEVAGRSERREPCSGYTRLSYHVCEAAEADPPECLKQAFEFWMGKSEVSSIFFRASLCYSYKTDGQLLLVQLLRVCTYAARVERLHHISLIWIFTDILGDVPVRLVLQQKGGPS